MQVSIAAIICAAGYSSRMGGKKKEYLPLTIGNLPGEKPITVLGAAVSAFASSPRIGPIVITVPAADLTASGSVTSGAAEASLSQELRSRVLFVQGGPTRRASVHNALLLLEGHHPSHVLIHDGARPWIKRNLIEKVIEAVIKYKAVIPALPLVETPKELSANTPNSPDVKFIERHLRRIDLYTAQTPQAFQFPEILSAHEKAREKEEREHYEFTDDAEIWGEFEGRVAVISGDLENRKITFPEDLNAK